jgi:Carboxypeptidase regulatory-like domain
MRGRAFLLAFAAAVSLLYGETASAVAVERIPLSGGGRSETAGFPPGVFLTLVSPPQYVAESPGRWTGPAYWPSGDASRRAPSSIDWSVSFRDRAVEPDSAAAAATPRGWREQERAGIAVPHIFGRTALGTLPSYFVLKFSEAMYESALAIPISSSAIAIVKFTLRTPERNTVPGFGENLVLGSFLASTWNRGQAFLALSGVQLEGNLPPSLVSIRRAPRRPAVSGQVVDAFKHPLVGVRVVLERQAGAAWRRVGSARTGPQGTYTFATRRLGRYRVTVSVANTTVRSATIRS